jgi:4-carboxymuconolactone decarboxylase
VDQESVVDTDRFPVVTRESLSPEAKAVWDERIKAIQHGPTGHFNVLMHTPELCRRVQDLEGYFRFDSVISEQERELVTLVVARQAQAGFAWGRHEHRAIQCGVPRDVVEAVRALSTLDAFPPAERLLVEFARALAGARQELPDELFRRVLSAKGQRWTIEAIALVAHYSQVAVLIHGYGVRPRPSDDPNF